MQTSLKFKSFLWAAKLLLIYELQTEQELCSHSTLQIGHQLRKKKCNISNVIHLDRLLFIGNPTTVHHHVICTISSDEGSYTCRSKTYTSTFSNSFWAICLAINIQLTIYYKSLIFIQKWGKKTLKIFNSYIHQGLSAIALKKEKKWKKKSSAHETHDP